MKVAIITLHRVFNYGSVLQTYATQRIFEKLGYNVEVIDYITEQRTNKRLFLSVPDFIKQDVVHRCVYIGMKSVSVLLKKRSFGGFLKKYVNLSEQQYITANDIEKNVPKANVYVAGSDQIWNSVYNEGVDRGFFLDFIQGKKKISFASSFGKSELESWEIDIVKKYLSEFSSISVRETQAVNILNELGIKSTCIVDPTLQLRKEEWIRLASKRLVKEKYLLLMLLYNEDNGATEYARKIADKKGLILVKLSWELKKPVMVDKLMTHRSPEDFLSLFYHADFIVTNSFHGLAFSINLNKEFAVFPRSEYNSRIESLLCITGLSNRMIREDIEEPLPTIDYAEVNSLLEIERQKAQDFLTAALRD